MRLRKEAVAASSSQRLGLTGGIGYFGSKTHRAYSALKEASETRGVGPCGDVRKDSVHPASAAG
jgi:hypothetical protein